ncbi:MAG TPA: VIT and VWA domain-containing protein [Pyrinomonadaceae bacterium]|nr:VIT and VWA domain-containing protein [Pyrinomonadaceae bacterium]
MTRKLNLHRIWIAVLAFAIISAASFPSPSKAQEQKSDPDKTLSPYFFVQGDPAVDQLPLKDTKVEIAVSGVISDVRVMQIYQNEGARPINATYVFPASTRAAVYGMRMKIGDDVIVARIKEREQAKQEFETAKKEGKRASLLEQARPNVFTMSLANLMPNETVEIELRYTELLIPTDGVYEVVYPTVVGPRYRSPSETDGEGGSKIVETPYLREGKAPTSTFDISARVAAGVPIRELQTPSHQMTSEWQGQDLANLRLEGDRFQGNRDFVMRYRLAGEQIAAGLILYEGEDENFFLYMAQPPQRVTAAEMPAREYVFVVDVSGSMEGFPLDTSKKLLEDLIGGMRPNDFFNVILFSGDSTALAESPLPANQENISRAIQLIDEQRGSGGTELLPAIQQAIKLPTEPGVSRSVVLITDGYVSIEKETFRYIREHLGEANVFAFGIGSGVNRYLIEGVAKAGMGEPFVVEDQTRAADVAGKFREYIKSPVLTDIKIQTNGFETYDVHPATFPDLLAQRPVVLFGKWRGKPSGTIELTGKTGRGNYSTTLDVSAVTADEGNRALRFLWARSRIAELSDYGASDVSESAVTEITNLGLKYNLLTKYTSFIAVREKIVNPNGDAADIDQPLPLPLGVSDMAVGSEPELVWLLVGGGIFISLMISRRRMFWVE